MTGSVILMSQTLDNHLLQDLLLIDTPKNHNSKKGIARSGVSVGNLIVLSKGFIYKTSIYIQESWGEAALAKVVQFSTRRTRVNRD